MKTCIHKEADKAEFYTPERCFITELSNSSDDADVSIARARIAPGVTTCWHRLHGISERYCIISGKGLVEIGELPPEEVQPGDVICIPPLCRQRITNTGETDLLFLAVCSPRFSTESYEDMELQEVSSDEIL